MSTLLEEPQPVLVRCRRFVVQVTYDPFGGLSPLEEHLLRMAAAGVGSVNGLARALSLPRRLVLDACVELLQAGLLFVVEGRLEPSPVARGAMGPDPQRPVAGWTSSLCSAATPEPDMMVLVQELLSGSLLVPPQGPGLLDPWPPEAPIHPEVPRLEDVPKLDLLVALGRARAPRRDEDSRIRPGQPSRPIRIREARIMRSLGSGAGGLESRDATVVVSVLARRAASEADPPRFSVVGPDSIPMGARRRMTRALSELWQLGYGRGSKQFFSRLRFVATDETELEPAPHPRRVVARLVEERRGIRGEPKVDDYRHLLALERDIGDELGDALAYTSKVETSADHRALVLEALANAQLQVVLTVSGELIEDEAVMACAREAAERGATVIMVASRENAPRLTSVKRTARGGAVVVAAVPMAAGAVVVQDLAWIHVASGPRARGLRIEGPASGRVARAIPEVLGWLRSQLDDPRHGKLLLDVPALFGRRVEPGEVLGELPAPPEGSIGAKLWGDVWDTRVREHHRRVEQALPLAIPVFDGGHDELLAYAVRDARKRLAIASSGAGDTALPMALVARLIATAGRGTAVHLVLDAARSPGPDIVRQRAELEAAGVVVVVRPDPGDVLLCDDWCVVGSHCYLHPDRRQQRGLSVRAFGDEQVDAVYKASTTT
jgi:hypothetical protein